MGYYMPEKPAFLERAMQGLAFWIGHRSALFNNYPLPEAALVAEMCNLIQANLDKTQKLCPEILYRRIVNNQEEILTDQARADLIILPTEAPDPYKNDVSDAVQFVFEIKRASSSKQSIDDDLRRLYAFKQQCQTQARAFLIIASEGKLPERFVDKHKGKSRLHSHEIPETAGCYHVRRTVKAAASFERKETAHYVCIVEIFDKKPLKLPKFK